MTEPHSAPAPLIRSATAADAPALSQLAWRTFIDTFVDGFGIAYPQADLDVFRQQKFSLAAIESALVEPGAAWWVAEAPDGALMAFANAGPNGLPHPDAKPTDMELRRLYVDVSAQGLGLGKRLLDTALDWMEAQGKGPLWLGVWSENHKAQSLYRAYGFEKVGDYQFPVGTWRDDEHIYRRG